MKPARRSAVAPPGALSLDPASIASMLPLALACALSFVVAFFPDARLVRLKLLGLELGIAALAAFVGMKLAVKSTAEKNLALLKIAFFPALFVALQAALWAIAPERSLATVEMRRVVLAAASFLVFAAAGFSSEWRRRFLWSWTACAGLVALYGILQKTGGALMVMVPQMDRPMGTFGNPIFFAAYLLLSLFVTLQTLMASEGALARALALSTAVVVAIALALTKTRAAWIGLSAATLVGVWLAVGRRRNLGLILLGLLLAGAIAAAATRSVWSRDQAHLLIWRDTLSMWKTHPVVGVGLGAFHVHFPDFARPDLQAKWPVGTFIVNDAHNEYLQELAEGGVVGLAAWLIVPLFFGWLMFRNPALRRENAWLIAGVVGVGAQNFFSVDMRFGVSVSIVAQIMGLVAGSYGAVIPGRRSDAAGGPAARAHRLDSGARHAESVPASRWISGALWMAALAVLVVPRLLRPYRANQEVQRTPGFFDQRLLEPAKTINDLEALAAQFPTEPAVLEKLGYVYAKEIQQPDRSVNAAMAAKAIATYERVRALDPKRPAVYNNLANIHYTLGQTDQAIALWRAAVEQDPHFVDARLNLGKILYLRGRLKDAAAQFDAVLKDDPANAEATVYLKRMVE